MSTHRWSDTHVTSSGGGGFIDPQIGGRVHAPRIESTVVQRIEVFSKDEAGTERRLDLKDIPIGFHSGNRLLCVSWYPGNRAGEQVLYLENLDTREFHSPGIRITRKGWSIFSGLFRGIRVGMLVAVAALLPAGAIYGLPPGAMLSAFSNADEFEPRNCAVMDIKVPKSGSCPPGYTPVGQSRNLIHCRCTVTLQQRGGVGESVGRIKRAFADPRMVRTRNAALGAGLCAALLVWFRRNASTSARLSMAERAESRSLAFEAARLTAEKTGVALRVNERGNHFHLAP